MIITTKNDGGQSFLNIWTDLHGNKYDLFVRPDGSVNLTVAEHGILTGYDSSGGKPPTLEMRQIIAQLAALRDGLANLCNAACIGAAQADDLEERAQQEMRERSNVSLARAKVAKVEALYSIGVANVSQLNEYGSHAQRAGSHL